MVTLPVMLGIGVWVVLAAAPLVFARVWVARNRDRYTLAQLFELDWWMWPLARYAIRQWKQAAHRDDLWVYCGYDEPPRSTGYITIRGWYRDGFQVRRLEKPPSVILRLGPGFPHGDEDVDGNKNPKKELVAQARGEFDLGLVDYDYKRRPWNRHVVITPKLVVPTDAFYADEDVRELVDEFLTPTTFVPAIGRGDKPHLHSLLDDAPHTLISGTTGGGGKSSMLRTVGVQAYQMGAFVLIIDPVKKVSHLDWAIDPDTEQPWPGIYYVNSYRAAAQAIVDAGKLIGRRGKVAEARMLRGETVEFPRLVILLDDVNGFTSELKRRSFDDARHYLSLLLWAGRQVSLNIFAAFQRASARAALDGDVRTCFGCRVIADGSEATRKMIADEIDKTKMPKILPQSIQPGHSAWVYGSRVVEAQRIFYEPEEARDICCAAAKRRVAQHRVALPGLRALNPPPVDVPAQSNGSGRPGQPAGQLEHDVRHEADGGHHAPGQDEPSLTAHRSAPIPARVGLDVAQVQDAARYDDDEQPCAEQTVQRDEHEPAHDEQDQREREGEGLAGLGISHATHTSTTPAPVKLQYGDSDTRQTLDNGRGEDQPYSPQNHALHSNSPKAPPNGSSFRETGALSMQAFVLGSNADAIDGGIEYLTLRAIAEFEWCPYGEKTLARYLRDPEKFEPFIEAGGTDTVVIPGKRGQQARHSMRAVRDFVEFLDLGGRGEPGNYVVRQPGAVTVKLGESSNMRRRLKGWNQPASNLIRWIPQASKKDAQAFERWMHGDEDGGFGEYHDELEWFRYEGRLVDWVESLPVIVPNCLREKVRA